jgi:hypothetical protein
MKRASVLALSSLVLFTIGFDSNCATITRKSTQRIPITSAPLGATVSVNGVAQGVTPLEVRLKRKVKDQVIRTESPGYNPVEIRPRRKLSGGPIAGNFLLGLIPGAILAGYIGAIEDYAFDPGGGGGKTLLICVLGAAAFGGLFTAVDSAGDGYELEPRELTVTLEKTEGAPRVDMILLDTEDFRIIKWIRVHRK